MWMTDTLEKGPASPPDVKLYLISVRKRGSARQHIDRIQTQLKCNISSETRKRILISGRELLKMNLIKMAGTIIMD